MVALETGAVMAVTATGLLIGGIVTLVLDRTQRDDAGLLTSGEQQLQTSGSAVVTEGIDLQLDGPDWLYARRAVGDIRLRVSGAGDVPVFVGIAPEAAVSDYLGEVAYDQVSHIGNGQVTYRPHAGAATPAPPTAQTFWAASAAGTGTRR